MNEDSPPIYERPWADWLMVGLLVGGHALLVVQTGRGDFLSWYEGANVRWFYSALVASVGILVAVISAVLSILATSGHDRIAMIRRHRGQFAIKVMFSVLLALVLLFAISLAGLAVDPAVAGQASVPEGPSWVRWGVEATAVLVIIRMSKALFIYRHLLGAQMQPATVGMTAEEIEGPRPSRSVDAA